MIYLNDLDVIRKFEDICKSQNCDLINYKDIFLISLCENKLDVCKYIYGIFCENCIENNINSINNMNSLQYTTLLNLYVIQI